MMAFKTALPQWLEPEPPPHLIRLCRRWLARHPQGQILPPSFGADAPRLIYLRNTFATACMLRLALLETPRKREGYEDARRGLPALEFPGKYDALKYEEGRLLYYELLALVRRG